VMIRKQQTVSSRSHRGCCNLL